MEVTVYDRCRACGDGVLSPVLDLGSVAVSDFVAPGTPVDRAPLTLVRCPNCELVQLRHSVAKDRLYRRYWYRSGVQPAMVRALQDVVNDAQSVVKLKPNDWWVDVGANDGTLLSLTPTWVRRLGFEPASNLIPSLQKHAGAINDYFPPKRVPVVAYPATVLTSIAMLYDVDDLPAFVREVKKWLAPDGVWVLQVSYLPETLATNNVGDIVHEHTSYFHLAPLFALMKREGLVVTKVAFNDVNGGSVRLHVRWRGKWVGVPLNDPVSQGDLDAFAKRAEGLKRDTAALLRQLKAAGRLVVGLGASTKSSTMLDYYGIGPDLLPAIGDRNPEKDGLVNVTGIPVVTEDAARAMNPDYFLILPFHFADPIIAREREHGFTGDFILPLPELRVVGKDQMPAAA